MLDFPSSPESQLLSALSRIQNSAETCRAHYALGFSNRMNLVHAIEALEDAVSAQNDALDALKCIAEAALD